MHEMNEETERKIVVPGEVIAEGEDYLPGEGTRREAKEIISSKFGLAEISGRLIRVIPLSGVYMPRRGNVVIGRVEDVTFNGWIVNINAPYLAFLSVNECSRFINKDDLTEYYDVGDMLVAKVSAIKQKGIDLSVRQRGLGKLHEGMIISINSNKVPRVIGREGSMVNMIKKDTGCDIVVGQNGLIWLKGNKVEDELFAKEAVLFVTSKSFVSGLTEKVKDFLEKSKKEK